MDHHKSTAECVRGAFVIYIKSSDRLSELSFILFIVGDILCKLQRNGVAADRKSISVKSVC